MTPESERSRSIRKRLTIIDGVVLRGLLNPELGDFAAGFLHPIQAEMPFADAGGDVALILEILSDGEAVGFDQPWTESTEHAALQT